MYAKWSGTTLTSYPSFTAFGGWTTGRAGACCVRLSRIRRATALISTEFVEYRGAVNCSNGASLGHDPESNVGQSTPGRTSNDPQASEDDRKGQTEDDRSPGGESRRFTPGKRLGGRVERSGCS